MAQPEGRRDAEASADLWPAPRALFPPQSAVRAQSYKPHRDIIVTSTPGSKRLKMTAHYIDNELEYRYNLFFRVYMYIYIYVFI